MAWSNRAHVDHMHPDALIAIAASADCEEAHRRNLRRRDRLAAVDPPGLRAGSASCASSRRRIPKLKGAVLEAHGLFTWADTSKACYENTLDIINRATHLAREQESRGKRPFGAVTTQAADHRPPPRSRRGIMPMIRGIISAASESCQRHVRKVGHFDDSAAVLDFVGGEKLASARGARHLLPRSFPAHEDLAAGAAVRSRARHRRAARRAREAGDRGLSRAVRRLLRALQAPGLAEDARCRIRWSIWCPASA